MLRSLYRLTWTDLQPQAGGSGGSGEGGRGLDLLNQWLQNARQWLQDHGQELVIQAAVALLILIVFWILARVVRRIVKRTVSSSRLRFTSLLQDFFVSIAGKAVLFLGFLLALAQVGISLGPVLAGIGAAGFILGFAVKDSLGNFAAGLMVLMYRPYDVGDVVEAAGVTGKVTDMSLVSTIIHTPDNQKLIVPNGQVWSDVIKNITAEPTRRIDLVVGISYDDDIEQAERVLQEIVTGHELVLEEPAPVIKVHNLGDSSVDLVVRPWVETPDYWNVRWDLTRAIKLRFDAEGIELPYPQRDVHLFKEDGDEA